ncbi:MAG: SusC/RagA family TonB-linked outer membrane protein, partial [Sediminibacterium sp.]|nr:SusC/RagA family TonB-linked outer membrane protein [Sediminibacterium sp.]
LFSKKGKKGQVTVNFTTSNSKNEFINSGNFGKANLHPYKTDANGNLVNVAGQILKLNDVGTLRTGSASAGITYTYGTNVPWNTSIWGNDSTIPGRANSYARYGILDPRNNFNQTYKGNFQFYDHFSQVFLGNNTANNAVNVIGGSDKVDYNFSLSNNFNTSPFVASGYVDRTNVSVNLGFEVFKDFRIRTITQLINTINTINPEMGAPGGRYYAYNDRRANVSRVYSFLNTSPFFDLTATYDGKNYPSYQVANFLSVNASNPYFYKSVTDGLGNRTDILQSVEADYKVNKYLTLNAKYGVNNRKEDDKWTYFNQTENKNVQAEKSGTNWAYSNNNANPEGEITNFNYEKTFQNFIGSAFIKTDFENDFKIKFPLLTTTQIAYDYRKQTYKELNFYGISLPLSPPINLKSTGEQSIAFDYNEVFVTYGYLLNQKFDIGNYGGVTVGFRSDYSSKFGEGSKAFTFPNYNAYLNLSGFKFWDNIYERIPQFKLRYAYGEAGIQPGTFDRYPGLDQRNIDNQVTYSNQIPNKNPALDVEVSKETEYGFDLTLKLLNNSNFLQNLNISFTNWSRTSENVIFNVDQPSSTGSTSILTNAINLSSKGFQFSLNMPIYKSKDFTWDFTLNMGNQASYIDKIAGDVEIPLTASRGSTSIVLKGNGYKIGQIYGYRALTNVNQLQKDGTRWISEKDVAKYEIVQGRVVNKLTKAIFFSSEAEAIGDGTPDYTGSIINSFNWKNIVTFGFQFDFVQGNDIYNQTKEWMYRDGIS